METALLARLILRPKRQALIETAQRPNSVSMVVSIGLSHYLFYDAAGFEAGQPKIKSLKAIRKPFVVDSEFESSLRRRPEG